MATLADPLSFARAQSQTDSNGLTDANGIIFANEALLDFHRKLITAGVDASGLQESYTDAVAGQGTYLYPTDQFFLKTIELNYGSTEEDGYIQARQIDAANSAGGESFSYQRENGDPNRPMFDDRGDWFEIFPTPTGSHSLTSLIKIFYFLEPTQYTATTNSIAYPESLDSRILGWRMASNYLYSLGKVVEAREFNEKYQEKVKDLIETLSRGSQQPIQPTQLNISGFEF